MDPDSGSAAREQLTTVDPLMGDATDRHPIALAERAGLRRTSACCGRPCSGGPARVWCTGCGRTYQADELFAAIDPRIQPAA